MRNLFSKLIFLEHHNACVTPERHCRIERKWHVLIGAYAFDDPLPGSSRTVDKTSITRTRLAKPFIKVFLYEIIIEQKGIRFADAIDLLALSGREFFGGIKAPASFKQPLPAENFVNAG